MSKTLFWVPHEVQYNDSLFSYGMTRPRWSILYPNVISSLSNLYIILGKTIAAVGISFGSTFRMDRQFFSNIDCFSSEECRPMRMRTKSLHAFMMSTSADPLISLPWAENWMFLVSILVWRQKKWVGLFKCIFNWFLLLEEEEDILVVDPRSSWHSWF